MKPITRDIVITITVKLLLLFALWWVCVKGKRPVLQNSQTWLLGSISQSESTHNNPTR